MLCWIQAWKVKLTNLLLINNFPKTVFQCLLIHITAYIFGIHNVKYAETYHAVNCTILEYSLFIMLQLIIIKLWVFLISSYTVQLKTSLLLPEVKSTTEGKPHWGKKNEVDLKTSPLGNGTVFTKRSQKATWKNVDKSTSNGLLSSIDFRTDLESIGFLSPVSTTDRQSKAQSGFAYCLAIVNKVNLLVNAVLLLQATVDSQSLH